MIDRSKKKWRIYVMHAPKIILLIGVISGLVLLLMASFYWGCGTLIATGIFFKLCLRRIPFRPPHIGMVVVWDKRLRIIMTEGLHFLAPFFPFKYTVTIIRVEKTNIDITYPDVRCRARASEQAEDGVSFAGGEISINISYTYYPDHNCDESADRLLAFINSGGHQGVQKIIEDLIEEDVRQIASDKSWEEISFAGEEIRNALVKKITGEELRNPEALSRLNKNGFPDIADLGIRICRFNIGKVKEQGELAKAAEEFAKEVQRIRGKEERLRFTYDWIKRFKGLRDISGDAAIDIVQVAQGESTKHIQHFRGLDGPLQMGGALLGKLLQEEKKPEEKEPENKKTKKKKE